jgi:hypothetical protein
MVSEHVQHPPWLQQPPHNGRPGLEIMQPAQRALPRIHQICPPIECGRRLQDVTPIPRCRSAQGRAQALRVRYMDSRLQLDAAV